MADMLKRLMTVEVKQAEGENRILEIAGSTEDKDRMGDIIRADGWKLKPFKANPVFMWAHDYGMPPIGRATKVWVDKETKRLMFKIEFAGPEVYEFADTIYKLYLGGFLHATSVGFIPLDWDGKTEESPYPPWGEAIYTKQELLELSAVPVPANAHALVEARDQGLITVKEFEAVTKPTEPLQITDKANPDPEDVLTIEKPYPNEHACRLRDPDDFDDDSFRRTEREHEGKKYSVISGKLEGEDTMTEQAYRYNKEVWTAGEAKTHCKDHDGKFEPASTESVPDPQPRVLSQETLSDELDYVCGCIGQVGLGPAAKEMALNVVREVLRLSGDDIPVDIQQKVGAVLNSINKGRLDQIRQLAQDVLDSAGTPEPEGEKQVPLPEPKPDLAAEKQQRAVDVAEVANLVVAKLKGKRIPK